MRRLALIAAILVAACSPEKNPDAQPTAAAQVSAPVPAGAPVILAFGDSLYAGYRLNPGEGYPPRLEAALNAAGTPARVVNAGVSGDTTAAALRRLAFTLGNQPAKPDRKSVV